MAFYQRKPDIIIRNGTIVDGTGKLPYFADIAIIGDKIDYIGNLKGVSAPLEIDAHHKYVTPGFIDCHTHADSSLNRYPECKSAIYQGVTTAIAGNCGLMYAIDKTTPPEKARGIMKQYLDEIEALQPAMNTAWLCGHNAMRQLAGIYTTDYTEEQFQVMADLLTEAMEAGYIGLSTGLEFLPGILSRPEEVERLAQIVVDYDGNYSTHMRDEGYYVLEAVNEFLNVIRKTGLRGTVSHLNIKYDNGVPNDYLFKGMQMLKDAREIEHLNVYCDMLPNCFAPGGAMAMLPPWLYKEGWDKAREILADPEGREKVKNDLDRYWRFLAYGQWDRLLYINCPHNPEISTTPFAELVKQSGKEPVDVYLDAMMSAPTMAAANAMGLMGTVFHEQILIDSVISDPIYLWQTDSAVYEEGCGEGRIHDFMSMSQFFVRYVKELGAISIQDAVKKVGCIPAQHYGLEKRGTLEVGYFADINVFDLNELKINATFADPRKHSSGMDYVIVNGTPVIAKGEHTGARSGRVLRHLPKK